VKINDISGKEVGLGSRVAKTTFVDFCEHMPEKISSIVNLDISSNLFTPSSMSSEVRTSVNNKWDLLLSTERPIETQGEILKKIINEKIEPGKIEEIEYIDLRIKGKATFKLRPEEEEEENKEQQEDKKD
jgi:cell division septal protein FtsQ